MSYKRNAITTKILIDVSKYKAVLLVNNNLPVKMCQFIGI